MPHQRLETNPPAHQENATQPNVSPTHFSTITIEGLSLPTVLNHYLDWIEGRGKATLRRRAQGVPIPLDRDRLKANGGETFTGDNGMEIAIRHDTDWAVLRFIHRDDRHADVHWHSVVRLQKKPSINGLSSINVEHATGRSVPPFRNLPPTAGVPAVLNRLISSPGARTTDRDLSTRPIRIRAGEAENFAKHILLDRSRTLPILLVSHPNTDKAPLVDPTQLQHLLNTQAVVVEIESDATRELSRTFETLKYPRDLGTCFDGAARLYHPGITKNKNPREHYLWLPDRILSFKNNSTTRLAGEVAERATWRALPPRFFAILEDVDRQRSRERAESLLQSKVAKGSNTAETIKSLETLVGKLKHQLTESQEERLAWEQEAARYEQERSDSQILLEMAEQERDEAQARQAVAQARIAALESRNSTISNDQIEALRELSKGGVTSLTNALRVIESIYGERVTILPSAWRSAEDSATFNKPHKACELLICLVTEYWSAIQSGGDSAGKDCFSDSTIATQESENVKNRKGARKLRTFRYNDKDMIMWKHLKIGIKDSVSETWRCHFEFHPPSLRIVIGHCGKHLDFK